MRFDTRLAALRQRFPRGVLPGGVSIDTVLQLRRQNLRRQVRADWIAEGRIAAVDAPDAF